MLNALKNLAAYQSTNNMAIDELDAICDVDNNGVIDARDISALMNRLTAGASYSPGLGGVSEPSSVIQVLVGGLALISRLKRRKGSARFGTTQTLQATF
jgi:hypothetical protein